MSKLPIVKTIRAAIASAAAYGDDFRKAQIKSINGGTVEDISHALYGAHCTICEGTYLIVAFRGTQPARISNGTGITDLLADVSILPNSNGFHSGFSNYVGFLEEDLDSAISPILRRNPRIPTIITGHSLGGAMAQVYAFQFFNKYQRVPQVYAFDSPACMSSNKAAEFNSTFRLSWRVYIHGDVIVRLLNSLYTHTSQMAEVYESGRIEYEQSGIFESSLSHGVDTLIQYLDKARNFDGMLFIFISFYDIKQTQCLTSLKILTLPQLKLAHLLVQLILVWMHQHLCPM